MVAPQHAHRDQQVVAVEGFEVRQCSANEVRAMQALCRQHMDRRAGPIATGVVLLGKPQRGERLQQSIHARRL
ncbi:MAG: hypothetical protein QM770_08635 [Tepidisphaeraceae bacterium]